MLFTTILIRSIELFQIPFGDTESAKTHCVQKEIVYEDLVIDEVLQCQKILDQKCYTSQETIFESFTVRIKLTCIFVGK